MVAQLPATYPGKTESSKHPLLNGGTSPVPSSSFRRVFVDHDLEVAGCQLASLPPGLGLTLSAFYQNKNTSVRICSYGKCLALYLPNIVHAELAI